MPYVGRTPTPSPVTIDDIPANSIDASKIVDGSIEVSDIKDNSITDAKLNSTKLDGIADSANNYSHPAAHTVSEVTGLQGLLDGKTTETYVNTQVAALVASSPATLDTLNELAAALGNDPNFATTVTNSIGTKLPLAGGTMTGTIANFTSTGIDDNATSTRLTVADTGIDVTGTVTGDGLNIQNGSNAGITFDVSTNYSPVIKGSQSISDLYLEAVGGGGFRVSTTDKPRLLIQNNGDISFYEDTGTTPKFFWDASAESLGIGMSSPSAKLHIEGADLGGTIGDDTNLLTLRHSNGNSSYLEFTGERTATGTNWLSAGTRIQQKIDSTKQGYIQFNGDGNDYGISFGKNNTEHMRINSAGNVGIGTSSPTKQLDIFNPSQSWNQRASIGLATESKGTYNAEMYYHRGTISEIDRGLKFRVHDTLGMVIDSSGRVTMPYQPAFNAGLSSGGGSGVLLFNSVKVNVGSHYASATGRFTAPVTGAYHFSFFGMTSAAGTIDVELELNGADTHALVPYATNTGGQHTHAAGSAIVYLNAGDYVHMRNNNTSLYVTTGGRHSSFSGHLIG